VANTALGDAGEISTIERIRREAASIGPATAALCELILERRPHPEQGFRACLGPTASGKAAPTTAILAAPAILLSPAVRV
jgi:hypothetical protein